MAADGGPRLERRELLRRVFLHQNGLAALTALATLEASGALSCLCQGPVPAAELVAGQRSPWAVAASVVAACGAGWLMLREDEDGECLVSLAAAPGKRFASAVMLDAHRAMRERCAGADWSQDDIAGRLLGCVDIVAAAKASLRRRTSVPDATAELTVRLLEGILAAPLLPRVVTGYAFPELAPLFAVLELGDTEAAMRRVLPFFAPMYGLAGSYAQALLELPERVAGGDPPSPPEITRSIDRGLNVRASGTAHRGYFQSATRMIVRLFEELPLSSQPRAILDVGCGDGTWLLGLYDAVARSTERGRCLRQHPLHLIGVDLDQVALGISRRTLDGLPATCIPGDVAQALAIAQAVTAQTGIDLDDILMVRAFVDHNRPLSVTGSAEPGPLPLADGVYAAPSGSALGAEAVQRDWAAHYARWRACCGRHGLVVIEAHTLRIAEVNERLEKSHSLALQYYHALSGQSPIPYGPFQAAVNSAGLESRERALYPGSQPTTSISWLAPSPAPRYRSHA